MNIAIREVLTARQRKEVLPGDEVLVGADQVSLGRETSPSCWRAGWPKVLKLRDCVDQLQRGPLCITLCWDIVDPAAAGPRSLRARVCEVPPAEFAGQ